MSLKQLQINIFKYEYKLQKEMHHLPKAIIQHRYSDTCPNTGQV